MHETAYKEATYVSHGGILCRAATRIDIMYTNLHDHLKPRQKKRAEKKDLKNKTPATRENAEPTRKLVN